MKNSAAEIGPASVSWWCDWRGQCGAVIGSGPSAKTAGVDKLQGRCRVIAVNDSYQLAPWADVLYSCDLAWWQHHKGAPQFKGQKLTWDRLALHYFKDLRRIEIEQVASDELLVERPSYIGAGGNSGFQAFNLLIQFGANPVLLIGIDCNLEHGPHWHGRHPVPLSNPLESNVTRWRKAFDGAAARVAALGIEVINCSPTSKLTAYPKMTIDEALARCAL